MNMDNFASGIYNWMTPRFFRMVWFLIYDTVKWFDATSLAWFSEHKLYFIDSVSCFIWSMSYDLDD